MKNTVFLFLILVVVSFSCTTPTDDKISIGKRDGLYSEILKEQRPIWVSMPQNGQGIPFSEQRYPVVYLLDGDAHFHSVTGMLQQLSGNGLCPEMIVVGIPNTDRSRDLTPSRSLVLPGGNTAEFLKTTGGAGNFTSFIEKELIPYIDANYPTVPHRILIGHSFGGLFAVNTLINSPGLFNSYIAIDPSMWWDNLKLLHHADTVLNAQKFTNKNLFLSVANTMEAKMDTSRVVRDTASNSAHIRSILQLASMLSKARENELRFSWKYYDNDDHGSVPLISEYDAFRFLFDFYKPKFNLDDLTTEMVSTHFKMVSDRLGYAMLPPESTVNNLGYNFLQQKKYDKAMTFFELNIANYPNSQNAYDSMGDLYVAKGDTAKAIETFTKALSIKEMPATRTKLDELKAKFK